MAVTDKDIQDLVNAIRTNTTEQAKLIKYFESNNTSGSTSGTSKGGGGGGGGFSGFTPSLSTGFVSDLKKGLTGANANLAGAMSAFAEQLKGIDGLGPLAKGFADVAGVIQDSANAYRALAKYGGGFSGDLAELRSVAGQANMEIGPFVESIINNRQALLGFTGGINGGAKVFAGLIHEFEEGTDGLQKDFLNLGLTVEESREFIAKELITNQRRARIEGMSSGEVLKSTRNLAKNMQIVSRFTGQQADQLQAELQQRMTDGAVDAKMRKLENSNSKATREELKLLQGTLSALGPGYQNMFDEVFTAGTVVSDETQQLASINGKTYDLVAKAAHEFEQGNVEMAQMYAEQAKKAGLAFAQSDEGLDLAVKGRLGGVFATQAQQLEKVGPLINQIEAYMEQGANGAKNISTFMEAADKAFRAAEQEVLDRLTMVDGGRPLMQAVTDVESELGKLPGKINESFGQIFLTLEQYAPTLADKLTSSIAGLGDVATTVMGIATPQNVLSQLEEVISDAGGQFSFQTTDRSGEEKTVNLTLETVRELKALMSGGMIDTEALEKYMPKEEYRALYEKLNELGIAEGKIISEDLKKAIGEINAKDIKEEVQEQLNRTPEQTETGKQEVINTGVELAAMGTESLLETLGFKELIPKIESFKKDIQDFNLDNWLSETFDGLQTKFLQTEFSFGDFVPDIFQNMSDKFEQEDISTEAGNFNKSVFDIILKNIQDLLPNFGALPNANEGFVPAGFTKQPVDMVTPQKLLFQENPATEQQPLLNAVDIGKKFDGMLLQAEEKKQQAIAKFKDEQERKQNSEGYYSQTTPTVQEDNPLNIKHIQLLEKMIANQEQTSTHIGNLVASSERLVAINTKMRENFMNTNNYIRNLDGSSLA